MIGYNPLQKQEISIGKQNNQSFVSIPFQKLRDTIRMVANREGIPIVMQDESYTSKASCLDQHVCSKISRVRHGNRSERRAELMKAFGGTRKVWTPVKTAA